MRLLSAFTQKSLVFAQQTAITVDVHIREENAPKPLKHFEKTALRVFIAAGKDKNRGLLSIFSVSGAA